MGSFDSENSFHYNMEEDTSWDKVRNKIDEAQSVPLLIPVKIKKRDAPSLFCGFFPTSPLISLIFMTSPESKVEQIGLRHRYHKSLSNVNMLTL